MTTKDISVINEELELKSKDSFSTEIKEQQKTEENNLNININDDNINNNKLDSSTNETIFMNFNGIKKPDNKINDIKSIEQNKLLLSKRDRNKNGNKSRDKSGNKTRNKSSELKKRKNKKNENDINNTDIKGYFKENTKEHKIFTQLQNNIFLYCTKAKTAIVIIDSFSDKDIDKRYFNNILVKISQTRCPIIVLSNNLDYVYNSQQKKIKNLNINCILSNKGKRDINIIYLYNFIIYLNIKLCSLKFAKNIKSYEQLLEYINNIDIDCINLDLCILNLKIIYFLSEYLCYYSKFQIDIIDLRLTEIFSEVERMISENKLNSNDFSEIIEYIFNIVFEENTDISINDNENEKSIEELYSEYEKKSFSDYSDGMKEKLIEKYYKEKLNLNVSYGNYIGSKDSMVNLEGLLLEKYFNDKNKINQENNLILFKSFSFNDSINNKIINKVHNANRLFISYSQKKFISQSSLYNYTYPIKRILIMERNSFKFYKNPFAYFNQPKLSEEQIIFIDTHVLKKIFHKIGKDYFFNKSNINYASNRLFKRSINQKKIKVTFYDK